MQQPFSKALGGLYARQALFCLQRAGGCAHELARWPRLPFLGGTWGVRSAQMMCACSAAKARAMARSMPVEESVTMATL